MHFYDFFMKYIKRKIEDVIKELAKTYSAVLVTGARQVGKSTVLLNTFDKKIDNITFDDINVRKKYLDNESEFVNSLNIPIIIDEFQHEPDILYYIKKVIDEKKENSLHNENIKWQGLFFLSGSQSFETMQNITETLAGRAAIIKMMGLSTREIFNKNENRFLPIYNELINKENSIDNNAKKIYDRIIKGSYPELYRVNNLNREQYYEDYINTYIERDIKKIVNVQDSIKFEKFVINVAARTGQELNMQDICDGLNITNQTGERWLSLLEATNIIYLLKPYYTNTIKRIVKKPKIYFCDTGLCTYMLGYNDSIILEKSNLSGAIFETYVITEIIKSYINNGLQIRDRFYYYRDSNRREIDLLINDQNVLYPVEIKKSENPGISSIKYFDIAGNLGKIRGEGGVICIRDDIFQFNEMDKLIPVGLI